MQKIIPRKILTSILLLIITPVFFIYGETNLQKSDSEIPKESVEVQQSEAIPNDPIEALQREVKALHDEIRMLQSTLDLMINQIMSDLREENILLRKEVQRLYAMQEDYGLPDISGIPRPGSELIDDILAEALPINTKELLEEEIFTDEPFEFTPIHQWGRTLEVAEELGNNTPSLLGLIGIVPRNSRRQDIENLGRELRSKYDLYDNINIEVFDDITAAEQSVKTQVDDPSRRVLSISKHSGEGRDIILFLKNGKASAVTR